jgi:hypothetical protein
MKGIEVLRIHYTADPAKNDPRWIEHAKTDVPADQWAREMEMDAQAGLGMSIYGREYKPAKHERRLAIHPGAPMGHGWDFGYGCPATVWVQRTQFNGVRVIAEMAGKDTNLRPFAERALALEINALGGPYQNRRDYVDPAGNQPKDDGMKSIEVLRDFGYRPVWRGSEYKERHEYVSNLLLRDQEDGDPMFLIDPDRCPQLCAAFRAHYRRMKNGDPEREHPYIDLMNAFEYYIVNTKAPSHRMGASQALPLLNPISGYGAFPAPRDAIAVTADPWS